MTPILDVLGDWFIGISIFVSGMAISGAINRLTRAIKVFKR